MPFCDTYSESTCSPHATRSSPVRRFLFAPTACNPCPHVVGPCLSACAPSSDVPSASSSQLFLFGKSSALAEHNVCGTNGHVVGAFRGKAMELIDIFESLPPGEHKELLVITAFNVHARFTRARRATTSSVRALVRALKDFFDDNTSWRTGLEDSHF